MRIILDIIYIYINIYIYTHKFPYIYVEISAMNMVTKQQVTTYQWNFLPQLWFVGVPIFGTKPSASAQVQWPLLFQLHVANFDAPWWSYSHRARHLQRWFYLSKRKKKNKRREGICGFSEWFRYMLELWIFTILRSRIYVSTIHPMVNLTVNQFTYKGPLPGKFASN